MYLSHDGGVRVIQPAKQALKEHGQPDTVVIAGTMITAVDEVGGRRVRSM